MNIEQNSYFVLSGTQPHGAVSLLNGERQAFVDWLERFRDKYPHIIWVNPSERPSWGQYWCETYDAIARVFPMFPLTVDGLEDGMKKLLAR